MENNDTSKQSGACFLVGAGEFDARAFLPKKGDFIVAVDGGADALQKIGSTYHLLIGDLDSLSVACGEGETIRLPAEKDDTDMLAAAKVGLQRGYRRFCILGGTGGRLSHTAANIGVLKYLSLHGASAAMYGDGCVLHAVTNATLTLGATAEGGYVSVFSLDTQAEGVTLRGLKYPLTDYNMSSDFPIGVSNERLTGTAQISVKRGTLLVIEEPFDKVQTKRP